MAKNGQLTKQALVNPEPEMLEKFDFLLEMEMFEMVRDLGIEKNAGAEKKSGVANDKKKK